MNTNPPARKFTIPEDAAKSRRTVELADFLAALNRELFKGGLPPLEAASLMDLETLPDEIERAKLEYHNGYTVGEVAKHYFEDVPSEERRYAMSEYIDTDGTSLAEVSKRLQHDAETRRITYESTLRLLAERCDTTREIAARGLLAHQGGQWSNLLPNNCTVEQAVGLFKASEQQGLQFIVNPDDAAANKAVAEFGDYRRAFARVAIAHGMSPCDEDAAVDTVRGLYDEGVPAGEAVETVKATSYSDSAQCQEDFEAFIGLRKKSAEEVMEEYARAPGLAFTEKEWRQNTTALDRAIRFLSMEDELKKYSLGTPLAGRMPETLRREDWPHNDTLGSILAEVDMHRNSLYGVLGFDKGEEAVLIARQFLSRGMNTIPSESIYLTGTSRVLAERRRPGSPTPARPPGYFESELLLGNGSKIATVSEELTNLLRKQGIKFVEKPIATNDAPLPGQANPKGQSKQR